MNPLYQKPPLATILQSAHYVDTKTAESTATLREFITGFISYYPRWVKALYAVRWGFVRILGMTQAGIPQSPPIKPEDIPMVAGQKISFFTVFSAQADDYWICKVEESHLIAYLVIVREPLIMPNNRFHVLTVVTYKRWTGPVYFNIIRPFHHLVVGNMVKAGAHV